MKKFTYMLGAFILGIVVASSAGTVSAQVKSLIGQKVTGEYTVNVNGKELSDKGLIIDGKTNAPVRAISDAIGGKLDVDNKKKVIDITTDTESSELVEVPTSAEPTANNKYIGGSKSSLETLRDSIVNNRIKPATEGRENILSEIEILKDTWEDPNLTAIEKQLQEYDEIIAKATEELRLVESSLALLDK